MVGVKEMCHPDKWGWPLGVPALGSLFTVGQALSTHLGQCSFFQGPVGPPCFGFQVTLPLPSFSVLIYLKCCFCLSLYFWSNGFLNYPVLNIYMFIYSKNILNY